LTGASARALHRVIASSRQAKRLDRRNHAIIGRFNNVSRASMQPLSNAPRHHFSAVEFVLTDMDETLTWQGRLSAATYAALERLQQGGIRVVPVTAAPAGWADQMARMWPVDGVIAENGGLFLRRAEDGHGVIRTGWHSAQTHQDLPRALQALHERVVQAAPEAQFADDQPFRLTSLAYRRSTPATDARILAALEQEDARTTINNLWVLGWLGDYDKLSMSLRMLHDEFGVDREAARGVVAYSGDSTNDAPMFDYFRHTAGVSTVIDYLPQLRTPPAWITHGPGGAGFVEFADAILASKSAPLA
jgi:HAD superfamily hydrolase (TIGR01484 family)